MTTKAAQFLFNSLRLRTVFFRLDSPARFFLKGRLLYGSGQLSRFGVNDSHAPRDYGVPGNSVVRTYPTKETETLSLP